MKSFKSHLSHLQLIAEGRQDVQDKLVAAGKSAGLAAHSNPARVFNPKKMENKDFVALIKKEFEVEDVIVLAPKAQGNPSSTFFTFLWNDNQITLAGEVKGRGSRQTEEQELSWLLVLSAYYNGGGDLKDDELIELMQEAKVYSKIEGARGAALKESAAQGLVYWLSQNGAWFESHRAQAKKFITKVKTAPSRYVKDFPKLDIVLEAKRLFPKAVPGQRFDKDKWNPADIWLYYENLTTQGTLADLNNYLLSSIEGTPSGIIGVSLKMGTGSITTINARKRPVYIVDDFDMKFGDLFAQNVNTEYGGQGMEGYTVMYRLFSPKIGELIRGEANKKLSKAAHGKVFLKYIDHLTGGEQATKAVASVAKKIVELDKKTGIYVLTADGKKTFRKISKAWPIVRDNNIIEWASTATPANYNKLVNEKSFLEYVNEYAIKNKLHESEMQVRVMARFQTIMLGTVFSSIKRKSVDKLHEIVLGMLLFAKSESVWSAPHMKAQ